MSKIKNTSVFTATVDGKERELMVRLPTLPQQREGQKIYNQAWKEAVDSGACLRKKLEKIIMDQGLWNSEKETKLLAISKEIRDLELKLDSGGFDFDEAVKIAKFTVKEKRAERRALLSETNELDSNTAEAQAEARRFNYYISACMVYNDTQKPVFSSVEDYSNKATEDYAATGAAKLAQLIYQVSEDYESELAENRFLRDFGLADSKNRLIREDGRFVDEEGRLIDEEGRFVDEAGEYVDINGNRVDKEGKPLITRKPFLKGGKEVVRPTKTETAKTEEVEKEEEETVSV